MAEISYRRHRFPPACRQRRCGSAGARAGEGDPVDPADGRAELRHLRRELEAETRATLRFETPPGRQLQIDFGEQRVALGDEDVKVYVFVATLVLLAPALRSGVSQ